ncbi:M23 family metallopeptidase [Planococcus sp. ISL-109]|uniref:M23 family metallopeptidase n=1 Tax=Planococcus sp. ISL-109 TaxID=2819166 RepID=UPI001BE5E6B0|nr:M23 family metallopeptidase [Planococcus sp. ISL-109]MBT2584200.1 peptidoglycan DD-metalloendopeptidase family protein [Planococcus sp. ISL-109]
MTRKHYNEETKKLRKWKIGTILVLAASAFGANTIFAEPKEPQNLEPAYHIYHDTSYLGAVSDDVPIDELIQGKIAETAGDYEHLRLAASDKLTIVTEQTTTSNVRNDEAVISQLGDQLAIKAEAFALQVDGEPAVYVKDRKAYDETIKLAKETALSGEELTEFEQQQTAESLPTLKAGESRIVDVSFSEPVNGLSKQADPQEVMGPEQAAEHLTEELGVDVFVHKAEKALKKVPYETIEKDSKEVYAGETKVSQKGKRGEKAVSYAVREKNGERIGRSVTREKVLTEQVEKIVLEGQKELPGVGTGEFTWPADGGYVSSKKGPRWGRAHKGIDIARPETLDIVSADHGTVKAAGAAGTFGNRVIVDHNNGYETIYAHLSSIDVKVGDKVSPHTKLGDMGTTGRSTGIHLHFELSYDGQDRDPLDYVKK